ncbi:MAG: nickel pincer cofactor biosynthesis protein LarC [Symploca sp. SIO1A3]|nr:nickel pincer cofactor biosynthesis protein LarC [Symploca sp. SIO1A3]
MTKNNGIQYSRRTGSVKKLAYLDCQTGIAGDMCLAAVVSGGVPLEYLIGKLQKLGIGQEYRLRAQKVHCNDQLATKIYVDLLNEPEQPYHCHEEHHTSCHRSSRNLPEIERLIMTAGLPPRASEWSVAVFRKLAEAEGAVHGIAPEKVHFHEVGAIDAIVDIVGTCLGLDWLGIDQLYCSALPTGGGRVKAAHGWLPVPAPAVLKLWESRQVPVYSNGIERELVTPTGAALAVTLVTSFGSPPAMTIQKVGNGAGSIQLPIPNMLRLWIGEGEIGKGELGIEGKQNPSFGMSAAHGSSTNLETISVLETQIDDLSPQAIGYLYERLFKIGALDVFTQPIGMKKSRPGILLTVICHPPDISACEAVLFRETTTLGIRRLTQQRSILPRAIQQVQTDYGEIRVKVAWSEEAGEKIISNVQPEYEDCASIARQHYLSWREVHQLALDTWYRQYSRTSK